MLIKVFKNFLFASTNWFVLMGCSGNAFHDIASSSPDDSYLYEAKADINLFNYTSAIQILTTKVSAASQAKSNFKETLAVAYAGQCGLNFANFINGLAVSVSGTAFGLMMTPFVGVATTPASCLAALNIMESLGTTATRAANQNAFVAVVGMALMGTQTRSSVDKSPVNGDGAVDTPICTLPNSEIDNIILGFGFMSKNFSYLSTQQLGASSQGSINGAITGCQSVAGASCSITDPALITTPIRDTMRDLLNTSDYGVGPVASGGNPVLISGACP